MTITDLSINFIKSAHDAFKVFLEQTLRPGHRAIALIRCPSGDEIRIQKIYPFDDEYIKVVGIGLNGMQSALIQHSNSCHIYFDQVRLKAPADTVELDISWSLKFQVE